MMFETPRLHVRKIGPEDCEAMLRVYGNEVVVRWVGDGEPLTREGCARWIDVTLANYERRGYGMSAVTLAATGEVVGFVGLVHPGGQEVAELKYALGPPYWGQGYATEVAASMLDYGATEFGLRRVIATTAPENTASHRVLEKAGMVDLGIETDEDGDPVQTHLWQLEPAIE
ncbi:MAG: RimJ/RimL family protein N-acetyltransferase [Paracoccaceae bacterium]|jgi:RimJ/RimL family protein N-acetyltransferase